MLVVQPYHPGDAEQSLRFAEWLLELGGAPGHDLILIRDTRCHLELSEKIRVTFAQSFDSVKVLDFVDHYRKWPESPNNVFSTSARHIAITRKVPWLFCEPDCVLLKPHAFDLISEEYKVARNAGKHFLGDMVTAGNSGVNVVPHMSGNAVYPPDLVQHAGLALIANELAFDVAAASQIVPQMYTSKLILHRWKHPPFESWQQVQERIFDVKPEAVIFHADKTGSLYPLLREHMRPPVSKSYKPESQLAYAIFMFNNGKLERCQS